MQSASVNYLMAASGAGGVWAEPRLRADWLLDGYGSAAPTVNASPALFRDDFDRNPDIDTWGPRWTLTGSPASDFFTTGTQAVMSFSAAGTNRIAEAVGMNLTDFDVTVNHSLSASGVGGTGNITADVRGRLVDSSNFVSLQLFRSASGITMRTRQKVAGTDTTSSTVAVAGATNISSVNLRLQGSGATLRAKAWPAGTQQPTAWTTTQTVTHISQGKVWLVAIVDSGIVVPLPTRSLFDDFRILSAAIDDLSSQASSWTVTHHLDDGFPDSATFIAGVGVPELTASDLAPPPAHLTGTPMRVAEYYSPYNPDSPIYGLDRDVAAVQLDHGVITSAGPERIRVFTGQMSDIPVKGGKATLSAVSAARMAMKRLVQPPAFSHNSVGLNGSWPVSWALAQCGLYVSPPPRDGCRWWVPMHGSTRPFIPSTNVDLDNDATFWLARRWTATESNVSFRPTWVTGPYLLGVDCETTATEVRRVTQQAVEFGDGDDMFSQAGNAGRLELWIRGDNADVNGSPAGSGVVHRLASLRMPSDSTSGTGFYLGVNNDRKVFAYANDGAGHSSTLLSDDTLPTDGAWYFAGAAYDIAAKKLWVTNFAGTTKSSSVAAYVTSSLPATDTFDNNFPFWQSNIPTAEVHFTTGAQANVDDYPTWLNAIPFTPDVVMTPSVLELLIVAETEPVEAWEFVSQYAQAELASMRADENDLFDYFGLGWWVRDAQQQVVDLFSTEVNAATPDINIDPTKILNTVRVSYGVVEIPGTRVPAYTLTQQLVIPPGTTVVEFPFRDPVVALSDSAINFLTDADIAAFGVDAYAQLDYVMLNSAADGTGTYATLGMVNIAKTDWHAGSALWTFTNNTVTTWYTANTSNVPTLQISGYPVTINQSWVADANDLSVALRGERALSVQGTAAIQTSVDARRLARDLKMALRKPVPIMDELSIFGEPRRQPGDLVQFDDPSITRASGLWRTQSVTHEYSVTDSEVSYVQRIIVRPTLPICIVGEGVVGESLVGPAE